MPSAPCIYLLNTENRFLRTGEKVKSSSTSVPRPLNASKQSAQQKRVFSPEEKELQRRNLEEAARRRETAWDRKLEQTRTRKKVNLFMLTMPR